MKKILKYSTILGSAFVLSYTAVSADTGGYVRVKGFESHFSSLGFNELGCIRGESDGNKSASTCRLAAETRDGSHLVRDNTLHWNEDDGEGIVAGADYGFFRLEMEASYQDSSAVSWRGHTATNGTVHQARIFANVVVEPFDLIEILGEFSGVQELVKYNPAHYGISPYAMYGYGVMAGFLDNLDYTRTNSSAYTAGGRTADASERGAHAGGATAAVNVGAGVNISVDKLARTLSDLSGSTLPEYFKLPIELSAGYHFQAGLDEMLFDSMDEDLGIDDGGFTYSIGLRW